MTRTSILERLCSELCDAVIGATESADSQLVLEYLERSKLHLRAADWFEQNHFIDEAIDHALATEEQDRAARLVEQNAMAMLMQGRLFQASSAYSDMVEQATRPDGRRLPAAGMAFLGLGAICYESSNQPPNPPLKSNHRWTTLQPLDWYTDLNVRLSRVLRRGLQIQQHAQAPGFYKQGFASP